MQKKASPVLEGLTSYWTDRAHSYSEQNLEEMNDWRRLAWRELILSRAPERERLRVLDVGTGPGFFAVNLALAGCEVTAVDVTEHMLYHAWENAQAYGAAVRCMLHTGDELPFESGCFDLVVSRNVVWNLEFPEKALAEWQRVLSPGGRMVYFDANWYLYLFDEAVRARREELQAEFRRNHPDYTSTGDLSPERVADLERIAYSLPLTGVLRPEWDKEVLARLGMKNIEIVPEACRGVLDRPTWEHELPNPMFMVCAEKVA